MVKGLRVAQAKTLEEANAYLHKEYLIWWNETLTVVPAEADNAHRLLGKQHCRAASLSHVETRNVAQDYPIRFDGKLYQIARSDVRAGLRKGSVRVEQRLDGSLAVRFQDRYLTATECAPAPKARAAKPLKRKARKLGKRNRDWMKDFHLGRNDAEKKNSAR